MRYPTPARWRVRPLETHDGDTLAVLVDRGGPNEDTSKWHVRLKGVFAPELAQPGGPECRAFVVAWLIDHGDGTEWPVALETFRTPRSDLDETTLSRILGVITAADGANLNTEVQAFITAHGYPGGVGST